MPKTAKEAGEAKWDDGVPAVLHQYTAKDKENPNQKYASPDGKREAIYNFEGKLITDSHDIGTYNFVPTGGFLGTPDHILFDIAPWVIFGNDDDDFIVNEVIKLFE